MPVIGSCVVCERPDRERIDAVLAKGGKVAPVAREFNVARVTLSRHQKRCKPRVALSATVDVPPIPPAAEGVTEPSSLTELRIIHNAALKVFVQARASLDSRGVAMILPQLRRNLELREKLLDKKAALPVWDALRDEAITEIRNRIVGILADFPDARDAVAEGFRRDIGEAEGQ